jgi:hypothetical protein
LEETGLHFEAGGRNSYPDFRMVAGTEGFELKGLAYPGRVIPIVHPKARFETCTPSRGNSQSSIAAIGTIRCAYGVPFHITADLYASRIRNTGRLLVGRLATNSTVTPTAFGAQLGLHGYISTEQLRAIEHVRAAQGLVLYLEFDLMTIADGQVAHYIAYADIDIHPGVWNTEIERVDAAAVVEVLVPMPETKEWADALEEIRAGRELLRESDDAKNIDSALVKARIALELVRKKLRTANIASKANPIVTQRTQAEREAVMIEALYSYVVGAAHKDPVTKLFEYSRANAIMALATVAGLIRGITEQM